MPFSMRTDPVRAPFRRARVAVTTTFAVHAVVAGSLGPWIPRLKARSDLDAAGLGLALTGFAAGLVVGTRLAAPAMRRVGGRTTVRVGVPLLAAAFALLPFTRSLASLFAAFSALGLVSGLLDVAMNAEAVDVERRYGRRVMSAMHGTWSVSMLGGAALASVSVAAGLDIVVYFATVAVLLVGASLPILRWLLSPLEARDEFTGDEATPDRDGRLPLVVLLCLIAFLAFMTEGIAAEWSAVYLNESVGTTVGTAGLGVVSFAAGMAISRFVIDGALDRFEASVVVRLGEGVGAIALGTALVVNAAWVSMPAFFLLGLGIGPAVPLAFRAAGRLRLDGARSGLGIVLTAGYLGSILGPIAVGFTADRVGYRAAFVIPVFACVIVAAVAGAVRESGRTAPTTSSA
jgi:fucose permease